MINPLATAVLVALKKQLPPQYVPALKNFFVSKEITFQTKEIAFDKVKKGRKLAPFVSPMVGGKANRRLGTTFTSVEPAYLKPTDNVTSDHLITRMAGEALMGELSPAQRRNMIRADLLMSQEEAIVRSEEWMVAQLVKTGKVVVKGDGFEPIEIDYGRSKENNITLAADDKWSALDKETSTQPLDDIEAWASRCSIIADRVVMGADAWATFRQFKSVHALMDNRRSSASNGELGPINNAAFQWVAKVGQYDIYVTKGVFENESGAQEAYLDKNGVLVTGAAEIYMGYGAIQDVKANAAGVVQTKRYPSNWFTDNPSVEWLQTQTAPLPIMLDADEICYALV